jgi:hypothetical protein
MFGQWCPLFGALFGADLVFATICGFELCDEPPWPAASATPPPKAAIDGIATSTAAL